MAAQWSPVPPKTPLGVDVRAAGEQILDDGAVALPGRRVQRVGEDVALAVLTRRDLNE
jgi:hypothetical protein